VVNLPLDFYSLEEIEVAIQNMEWVGLFTNITAGLETAKTQINTEDSVQDVLIVMSDGFDSYSISSVINSAGEISETGDNFFR
jgi:hypothetical protein